MVRFIIYRKFKEFQSKKEIYIPIWLDLLLARSYLRKKINYIYIPIWLDLLCIWYGDPNWNYTNLHSNMVRFIINIVSIFAIYIIAFTFQYG